MQGLGWISLAERRAKNKAKVMFKILHGLTPARLSNIFTEAHTVNSNDNLRNSTKKVALPLPKRDSYENVTIELRYGMIYQRRSKVVRPLCHLKLK